MGGSITIGIIASDGCVQYYMVSDISEYEVIRTSMQKHADLCTFACESVSSYFDDALFQEEYSAIRYIVVDDNTVIYQMYGGNEQYTLTKKTLR